MQILLVQENVGLLIGAARRRIKQEIWKRLRPMHLTPPQSVVIRALHQGGEVTQAGLAEALGIDPPMACRVVRNLISKRLVRAVADPDDRRRFRLKLTTAGYRLAKKLEEMSLEFNRSLERGLSQVEREVLRKALSKIIANVDDMAAADVDRAAGGKR
jgi:DNA-binding MarR family transcriptional regulator